MNKVKPNHIDRKFMKKGKIKYKLFPSSTFLEPKQCGSGSETQPLKKACSCMHFNAFTDTQCTFPTPPSLYKALLFFSSNHQIKKPCSSVLLNVHLLPFPTDIILSLLLCLAFSFILLPFPNEFRRSIIKQQPTTTTTTKPSHPPPPLWHHNRLAQIRVGCADFDGI